MLKAPMRQPFSPLIPILLVVLFILGFLFVALTKPVRPPSSQPSPTYSELSVVPTMVLSAEKITQIAEIEAVEDINDLEVSSDGRTVYIPSFDENIVYVIDAQNDLVQDRIFFDQPFSLAVSSDSTRIFVATGQQEVVVWDQRAREVVSRLAVGAKPYEQTFSQDGKYLFVSNSFSDNLSVIDTKELEVIATVSVGRDPRGMGVLGRFLYVASFDDGVLSVVSVDSLSEVGQVLIGGRPNEVLSDEKRGRLYVTDSFNNQVVIVEGAQGIVLKRVEVDEFPLGMTIDRAGQKLYVVGYSRNTISVVDLERLQLDQVITTTGAFLTNSGFIRLALLEEQGKIYLVNTLNGKVLVYSY